ncbi:dipZ [Enterobacter asburiae]|uniref:DipZ n=1 Tax=Enterobacter asburiae TaxID=61645 RepID=A0A376FCS9_ENTAS|nr:dipZ [Enterobacter asburiae]
MFLVIAFLGGVISLLSPCTLPVIPLLFAGFQGQRRHILAPARGDDRDVHPGGDGRHPSPARGSPRQPSLGAGSPSSFWPRPALALIFPSFAQRIAGPAVSAGNVLNARSGQTRGMASAFLAGLAVGLLWSPCAGPILGAIFSINIAGHSAIATGRAAGGLRQRMRADAEPARFRRPHADGTSKSKIGTDGKAAAGGGRGDAGGSRI